MPYLARQVVSERNLHCATKYYGKGTYLDGGTLAPRQQSSKN